MEYAAKVASVRHYFREIGRKQTQMLIIADQIADAASVKSADYTRERVAQGLDTKALERKAERVEILRKHQDVAFEDYTQAVNDCMVYLSRIPHIAAIVVKKRDMDGLTIAEIARRLSMSPTTAQKLYKRGINALYEVLASEQVVKE